MRTAVVLGLFCSLAARGQLSPEEEEGRQIYMTGRTSGSDRILARIGDDTGEGTPAAGLQCTSCHGADGRGRPEGGAEPSDVRWLALSRPTTSAAPRARPAYSDELLFRAVTRGLDSAGNALDPVMPRYQMSRASAAFLTAYLKTLGVKSDPGVTAAAVRVGILLPPGGTGSTLGPTVRAVLSAFFNEANRNGGIFGRNLEPRFLEVPAEPGRRPDAIQAFISDAQPFALVASFLAGTDDTSPTFWQDLHVPVAGALSHASHTADGRNRYVFYLDGGLDGQVKALMEMAVKNWLASKPDFAVVSSPENQSRADAVVDSLRAIGWTNANAVASANSLEAQVLLVLNGVSELSGPGGKVVLVPGSLLNPGLMRRGTATGGRLFTAFPMLPSDATADGLAEYKRLADTYHLDPGLEAAQFAAIASAKLFTEALTRAGRDLTRERFIDIMQNIQDFQTGFAPPISFGATRREGLQSHVLEIDGKAE